MSIWPRISEMNTIYLLSVCRPNYNYIINIHAKGVQYNWISSRTVDHIRGVHHNREKISYF